MGGTDEFWSFAQAHLDDEESTGEESLLPSNESNDEALTSLRTNATTHRSNTVSPGVVLGAVLVGFLLLSSVVAFLIWNVSDENPNDLDGDGITIGLDACFDGFSEWTSTPESDHDGDGCHDGEEDDDDDNDAVPDEVDLCPLGEVDWAPSCI